MIEIHCTKKLLARLPVDEQGNLPVSKTHGALPTVPGQLSPLSGWHANLLTIQRRNCVMFVHDTTRFPLFIASLKKPDFANLEYWFEDALMNTLMKCGATALQLKKVGHALQRLKMDSQTDRSVQGSLNQMGQDAGFMLEDCKVDEILGYGLAANLAQRPCMIKSGKDALWPERDFLALLESLPEQGAAPNPRTVQPTLPENVTSMAGFRYRKDRYH
ncbi:hypothetical protein [Alcanivorax sp.]|jgi:hypothetical protein|uniref:DUF6933 domain-containing protein n=1 Tax=Alcanivorax sp. TaxID=1872427 RepID=UPI0025BB5AA0|nr:hypothetical protein [Alcanivorax sp.]